MRNAFAQEIEVLAAQDERVVLVTADIGNRLFDKFKARFPDRFINCGVAEANMTGVAAGLALAGFRPFTYTIAPFVTTRCLEQIRVDLCYHKLPVVVTSVGAGYSYASLGATHHACEDIAFLRALPEMRVVCPGDSLELRSLIHQFGQFDGPSYFRLGKKGEPLVHDSIPEQARIGKALVMKEGQDVALLSTGNLLPTARDAVRDLSNLGVDAELVSFHTVKPLDEEYLRDAFSRFQLVVSLEEHSRIGGFGSALAEWWVDQEIPPRGRLLRLGTPDTYPHEAGSQSYFREKFGLTAGAIAASVAARLQGSSAHK